MYSRSRDVSEDERLLLLLLPGLDGTGKLFARFQAELPDDIEARVVPFPAGRIAGYDELVSYVRAQLPAGRRFTLLGESFSGPLALRLAAEQPPGLVAVVLVATFHRRPAPRWLAALGWLARLAFSRPPPAWAIRRALVGKDAPAALVDELRAAVGEVTPAVLAARVRAALAVDAAAALAACRAPLLYLGGSEDRILRRSLLRDMRQVQPALELRVLRAPHLVLQLEPLESAGIVSEFLARASGKRDRAARAAGQRGKIGA